jgi:hypothetical protein
LLTIVRPQSSLTRTTTSSRSTARIHAIGTRLAGVTTSFRGSLGGRNRPLALGLHAPMVPRDAPPFPASCAFADAAIPRTAVAAITRGSAGGGRHPPDRADGHRRRGVKRAAWIATEKPVSETSRTSAAADDDHDASASRRAGRGYQQGAVTCGLLGTGAAVYGPARIAALALSGPSPSRGEAALVSVDRAAA